jgi:gliding motility-associated-like protein
VWNDEVPGGVITGSFTLGVETFGTGSFEMPVPPGSTIYKALFFAAQSGSGQTTVTAELNTVPYEFDLTDQAHTYNSVYGTAALHVIDITADLDPTVTDYTIRVSIDQAGTHSFHEFYLLIAYELPGAVPVWCDVFFSDANSAAVIDYTLTTSGPMQTVGGIAFATFAGFSLDEWQDCERVIVNGTLLGKYYGGDFNAVSPWGASGSFFFSNDLFTGLGDDDADLEIDGTDVLSDISGLVSDGSSTLTVRYEHCPSQSPEDNHVWLMVLAYTSAPCSRVLSLGPDTTLCLGDELTLTSDLPAGDHLWQDGSTANTYRVTTSGLYTVTVSDGACQWSDSVSISVNAPPRFDLGPDLTLCVGEDVVLDASVDGEALYRWQDGSTAPLLVVDSAGVFRAIVTREGCTAQDSVLIQMDSCLFAVEMPNVFTPNGDENNSTFQPIVLRGVKDVELEIRNRWGQLLFTSTALAPLWDGRTGSDDPAPEGTYFWVLRYTRSQDQVSEVLSGTLTLLR